METLLKNINLQKNYLVTMRTFEIGSLSEIVKYAYEGKDSQWKSTLSQAIPKLVGGVQEDINKLRELLNSHICEHTLLVIDSILFNLFTKQKKEERQLLNNSMYDGSQQSVMSRFQNSEISNITLTHHNNQINQFFIENFKIFFFEIARNTEFFQRIEALVKQHRPTSELRTALKSLVKTIQYIQFKESFNIPQLEENLQPLVHFYTNNNISSPNFKAITDDVNKILFGPKLDQIVRVLTSQKILGSQQEVHFAVGRIYFASHSRNRSNFNRNSFKTIKHTGRDLIYNIIRHYVVNQQPDKQKTQICSQKDTEKYPIPAFILNYLQLLFMPIYNSFQELFDKHIMANYSADQEKFYQDIFSSTTQYIIPFFQNLPIEFCNFFTQFFQIISENHDQFSDKMNDLFPVKQLFVNRFFLNPHLRQFNLPIDPMKEKDYVQALNWFSKLFYNNAKEDKTYNQNSFFLKLNSIVQDCFQKIVTNYHQCSGHVDVYNFYIVDPVLKKDYNFIYDLIRVISFSEHEQKEYAIQKFKQNFPIKKRIEQKQQMDIIREIATPLNENIQNKMNDDSPKRSKQQSQHQYQDDVHQQQNYNDYQDQKQKNSSQNLQNYSNQQQQQELYKQQENNQYNNNNPYNQNNNFNQNSQNNFSNMGNNNPINNNNNNQQNNMMNYNNNNNNNYNQNTINNNNNNQQMNPNYMNNNNANAYPKNANNNENVPKTGEYQGMYQQGNYQGNYQGNDQEDSEEYLNKQMEMIRLRKQKLEEEQMILERHRQKVDALKDQNMQKYQNVANYFQSYTESLNQRNYEDKIKFEYEKKLTEQFEQMIFNQKNNIELNEAKTTMTEEIIMLHQRNEFLKMIMKSRYPSQSDYIDTLDNKENLEQWKKTYELQQKQLERREKRKKRNQEDDEFYQYQNIITRELKKVEEADLKLEIHQKVHASLL